MARHSNKGSNEFRTIKKLDWIKYGARGHGDEIIIKKVSDLNEVRC